MQRRLGVLLAIAALGACGPARPEVAPVAGATIRYVQTFRLTERTSGGEELPDVRIERPAIVTCTASRADDATLSIAYGDVTVWLDEEDGEPDFEATDAGSAERAFAEEESSLARMYAALWATTAHLESQAVVDRHGAIVELVGGIEELRRARGDDPSTDLGGAFLESLVDDPTLLLPATDADGRRPLRFRLEHWKASLRIAAELDERGAGAYDLAYESRSEGDADGPFADLVLLITGTGTRDPATGMPASTKLAIDVSADVPLGPPGATRRDAAKLAFELARIDE